MPSRRTDERVTLMYMGGHTGQVRRYGLRRVWIYRAFGGLLVSVALLGVGAVDYVRVRLEVRELPQLRAESRQQHEQIREYSAKLQEVSRHLERVAALERKLRVITNLDPADPLPLPGIGGIDDSLIQTQALARLNRERHHRALMQQMGRLSDATQTQAGSLEALIAHLEDQTARLGATPSIAPTKGWVTSTFGYRTSPFTSNREFHRGLDIATRMRTPIVAPADGRVSFVGRKTGYGITVVLQHGYGIETLYGHMAEASVKKGQRIARGDVVGLVGNTGRSTGPHLHYQVSVAGKAVDPQNYILD